MKNTYIFSIQSRVGGISMIVIEENSRENAIQKAKIETLAPLKEIKSNKSLINLFHDMEYSFVGTVLVKGESYNAIKL